MSATFIQFVISLAVVLVPNLMAKLLEFPESARILVFGLLTGGVAGWWACHFFSTGRAEWKKAEAAMISAKAARAAALKSLADAKAALEAERNAEKQRQHDRDQQAKAIAEENERKAKEAAGKERLEKAIEDVRKKFERDGALDALVRKRGNRAKRFCIKCGLEKGEMRQLKARPDGEGWYCPECGRWVLPPTKLEESFSQQVRRYF